MKQFVHYFVALTCALLLLPLTARAQGGLITDTNTPSKPQEDRNMLFLPTSLI